MAMVGRARTLLPHSRTFLRPITTHHGLLQQENAPQHVPTSLPPNPSSGSPLYHDNWRSPSLPASGSSLVPAGPSLVVYSITYDVASLQNLFADHMTSQKWEEIKQIFEFWIRSLDGSGKPNRPDVGLYNHYLRANLMLDARPDQLLDLIAQMEEFDIAPTTASYNLVLKAMCRSREILAAEKLLEQMLQIGGTSVPDEESYNLVIEYMFTEDQIDSGLKYLELMLKSGHTVSPKVFMICAQKCVSEGRLDTLTSIIERCKKMDQNKALCPNLNLSSYIISVALQADHSKLAYFCWEFLARWIVRGENVRPPVFLSADEGLVVSALGVVARTYNPILLDASWAVLKRSLRQKKVPNPETYLGKIHAYASLGNLQRAFSTLNEFETAYGDSPDAEEFFSPFSSLHPLVVACCKEGFTTLDSVYFQLENLSGSDPPYKSVAALNCVILGSANIWDLERAYETFESISKTFGLSPDIHSYNALIAAFGKRKKTTEASRVFEHLKSLGLKPNSMTYSLLVDAHLINRDQKKSLDVISDMVDNGFTPSKETLRKVRRRCVRESDFDSDDQVQSFVRKFSYRMFGDARREQLFNLEYATEYS